MNALMLYPVYNPRGVINAFPLISKGLEKILSFTYKDTSMTKILNDILSGELLLWVIYYNHEYRGFMTTKIEDIPDSGKNLWIVHLFAKNLDKSVIIDGAKQIERYAKEWKCQTIRFLTMRDEAFERRLEGIGFKKGYTEFIKDVSNE